MCSKVCQNKLHKNTRFLLQNLVQTNQNNQTFQFQKNLIVEGKKFELCSYFDSKFD